jgi:nucleoside-diphosphate-sugar epimerase
MSVLITGITGFIGSSLAHRLVEEGHDVYGLIRHASRSELRSLESIMSNVRFVEGDLAEYHSVRSAIASSLPEVVFHLGAITPVRYSFDDPFPYAKINFEGTMNVAHAILEVAAKARLIAASTAEVYGWQPQVPTLEEARLIPSSPYGVSKVAADNYLQMATRVYGLKATVLRCNNTYGRIREKGFLVEYLIESMLNNRTVYIGAPDHIRDYMMIDDHVEAYLLAMANEKAIGEVFNVSPGNPISNLELAEKITKLTNFKGRVVRGSYPPGYPIRPAHLDTDYIVLNSEKIRSKLGWKPSVTLDEGLHQVVEQWQKP